MKKYFLLLFCTSLLLLELFCIKGIAVLTETFPLDNTEAITFTLSQNISGAQDFALSLLWEALKRSIIFFCLTITAIVGILSAIRLLRKRGTLKNHTTPSYFRVIVLLNAICLIILAIIIYKDIPVANCYKMWQESSIVAKHSDFYEKEYINPDSIPIRFLERRNLILIFLESMEYNFQDSANGGNLSENLIPEITDYIQNEPSFIPGGTQITGTGWTMADVVAKTCGIPLMFPARIPRNILKLPTFLPGATCLTDVLRKHGYNTVISKGAKLSFSGMDSFSGTHGIHEGFGLEEYKQRNKIEKKNLSRWGVKDSLHYEYIKNHINKLSQRPEPWMMWFITNNTHTPHGFIDPTCDIAHNISTQDKLPNVIKCSSRQLKKFIDWAKTQKWYPYTTIAVMGDHATMASPEAVGFKDENITHYWLDFFINSAQSVHKKERVFTSLDMFPTILESIGAEIPGRSLGLGRSLFAQEPTLIEKYGLDSLNKALDKRNLEYDYFLYYEKSRK